MLISNHPSGCAIDARTVASERSRAEKEVRTMKRFLCLAILGVIVLSSCGTPADERSDESGSAAREAEVEQVLEPYGLNGKTPREVIGTLDRLPLDERPTELMASVRPDELILTVGDTEARMKLADDSFYLSAAPFITQTHECFFHSLTTCVGELSEAEVHVKIVDDSTGDVLVDKDVKTFDNGFVGFWLPSSIEGTMTIRSGDKTGSVEFNTGADAPTCLTTLRLA